MFKTPQVEATPQDPIGSISKPTTSECRIRQATDNRYPIISIGFRQPDPIGFRSKKQIRRTHRIRYHPTTRSYRIPTEDNRFVESIGSDIIRQPELVGSDTICHSELVGSDSNNYFQNILSNVLETI
jgi:hypothetical protein